MSKKMNWEKLNKLDQVHQEKPLATAYHMHKTMHDQVVKAFLSHALYYKKKGLPVPEFKLPDDY